MSNRNSFQKDIFLEASYISVYSKTFLWLWLRKSLKTISNLNDTRNKERTIKSRIKAINVKRSYIKKFPIYTTQKNEVFH